MGWEGISALIAAGAAVITLIVGWLQLRGALRAADKSYRAALDAVKATATETHTQWLRTVRREAYAAFLLQCGKTAEVLDEFNDDLMGGKVTADQREPRREMAKGAVAELDKRALIVELEGPPRLGELAMQITGAHEMRRIRMNEWSTMLWAWEDLVAMAEGPQRLSVAGYYAALNRLMAVRPHGVTSPTDEGATREFLDAYAEMEEAQYALPNGMGYSPVIAGARRFALGQAVALSTGYRPDGADDYVGLQMDFRDRVREVLHTNR
jgi:hypothetical protein